MARKPKMSPEIRRLIERSKDLEAVNLQPEAARLQAQSDVQVTRAGQKREGQKVTENSARRMDAFDALKEGMAVGAYDAARRLERDMLTRRGVTDGGVSMDRVDCSGVEIAKIIRIVEAGERVDAVISKLPSRDGWLLAELIAPPIDRGNWRAHVAYITGETHTHAQGAVVRAACLNLRDAYAELEKRAA